MTASLVTVGPSWAIKNLERDNPRTRCGHCENYGWVIINDSDVLPVAGIAEDLDNGIEFQAAVFGECERGGPCPMCWRGLQIDDAQYGGRYWRGCRLLESTSWENGLTYRHTNRCGFDRGDRSWHCGQPAIDIYCNHHAVPENRVTTHSARKMRIPRLAVAQGPTMDRAEIEARKERVQKRLDTNERLERAGVIDV